MSEGFSITFICEFCRSERRAREVMIGPNGEQACTFCMCGTERCRARATAIAYWPGREIRFCAACLERADSIADHMGFKLSSMPILAPIVALLMFLSAGCSLMTAGTAIPADVGPDAAAELDAGAGDADPDGGAAVDSSPAIDAPPILEDAGPDAAAELDAPPAPTWRGPTSADPLELSDGVVCNPSAVLVRDGVVAGVARNPGTAIDQIDGHPVSACVVAHFDRGGVLSIRVVARAAGDVCGESCSAGFCGTGRELEVFADESYVGTVAVGGGLLEHVLPLERSIAIVTLCRGGHGAARDHLEIDSVEVLR